MLRSLSIRNIALISQADLTFCEGLNVLSGETGAGKSVILDSIDFVLGAKADKSMIRYGETECFVRAEFLTRDEEIANILREFDIEPEETLVVTRRLTSEGKGGAKINGCAVTFSMLKRITSRLVDVHGQSEHFSLLKESNQLRLVDKIAGRNAETEKEKVRSLLEKRKRILSSIAALGGDEGERDRRADVLRYQIEELTRFDAKPREEEELCALREKYLNAEKISLELNTAREALFGDGGAYDCLNSARKALRKIERYGDYGELAEQLDSALSEIDDVGSNVESRFEEIQFDQDDLERTEKRIDEIRTFKKKYGGSFAAMEEFLSKAKEEYDTLLNSAERLNEWNGELKICDQALLKACRELQRVREEAAIGFSRRVEEELKSLNISSPRFEVRFEEFGEEDLNKATAEGLGGVCFLFSANAGEPLKELGKIISGGEMSRFMLAVKAQMTFLGEIGTYLFDEIDAGIGGKTARVVAEKFCKIAKHTQVIAVSHLAQIAAAADKQFLIEKREEGDRTETTVSGLEEADRIKELARLFSGEGSELSLKQAEEFLKAAKQTKNSL